MMIYSRPRAIAHRVGRWGNRGCPVLSREIRRMCLDRSVFAYHQSVDRSFVWDAVLDVDFFLPVDVVALAVEIGIEVEGDADGLVMVVAGSSIPRTGV
jgi:hypothetical protein